MPAPAPQHVSTRIIRWGLTALWLWTLTLTMQRWIGETTIYTTGTAARVEAAHAQIISNTAPAGGWGANGMNGVNVRIGAVWLAEELHQVTGKPVTACYELLDTTMLFSALVLLLLYLRDFQPEPYPLLAVSFFGTLLPLTYQLFFYHPWDRLSLVAWVVLLTLMHRGRLVAVALLLPFAVAVKYDIMLLPGVLGLHALITERRVTARVAAQVGALLAIGIGTYVLLGILRGGGNAPLGIMQQVRINFEEMSNMKLRYPPFLGFAVPLAAAAIGFRSAGTWAQACVVFGLLLFVPFALRSNLAEFRAQVAVVVLLAPAALAGVRLLVQGRIEPPSPLHVTR